MQIFLFCDTQIVKEDFVEAWVGCAHPEGLKDGVEGMANMTRTVTLLEGNFSILAFMI